MALQYLGRVYTKLKGIVKGLSGQIPIPSVQSYVIDGRIAADITVRSLGLQTSVGSVTVSLEIDGTPVTGCTSVTGASDGPMVVFTATGANIAVAGQTLVLNVTAVSDGAADLDISIHYTEN